MQHAAVPAELNKHGDEHASANQVQMQRGFGEVTAAEGLPYGSPLAYQDAAPTKENSTWTWVPAPLRTLPLSEIRITREGVVTKRRAKEPAGKLNENMKWPRDNLNGKISPHEPMAAAVRFCKLKQLIKTR